jgi:hypothetical protein
MIKTITFTPLQLENENVPTRTESDRLSLAIDGVKDLKAGRTRNAGVPGSARSHSNHTLDFSTPGGIDNPRARVIIEVPFILNNAARLCGKFLVYQYAPL